MRAPPPSNLATTTVVIGHQAEALPRALAGHQGLTFVVQEPQLGTAHALMTTEPALAGQTGMLVLLSGDVPLLTAQTLRDAGRTPSHQRRRGHRGHGGRRRAARATAGSSAPASRLHVSSRRRTPAPAERAIREINSGIYAFALDGLFDAVRSIAAENAQNEYYLPDLVAIYRQRGLIVETVTVSNPDEIRGINSRVELAAVSRIVRDQKTAELMASGVTIEDPATTYVDAGVTIGRRHDPPSRRLARRADDDRRRLRNPQRRAHRRLADRRSRDDSQPLRHHELDDRGRRLGRSVRAPAARVGCSREGEGRQLRRAEEDRARRRARRRTTSTYLGDATIGEKVNIGAGTITCNYDGVTKSQTVIEDGAFIGSDSQLIAPVTIGKGAYVGSGSTIRENVPAGALAVSAGKQRNIEGWVERKEASSRPKG